MKKILVPLDGSEYSEHVLEHVGKLAATADLCVRLLLVHPERPAARKLAAAYLDGVVEKYKARLPAMESRLMTGNAPERILREAGLFEADLVAMTTHGRSGVGRAVFGSVAEEVVSRAATPLLLVRPGAKPRTWGSMLVPIEPTPRSRKILPTALDWARSTGGRLILMRVVTQGPVVPAVRDLERLLPVASRAGVVAKTVVHAGDPLREILAVAASERADVIALATHGRAGLARLVEGSVTEEVLRRSDVPLLVEHVAA
jgi:nucleotide-binding universal stress UspA family protein